MIRIVNERIRLIADPFPGTEMPTFVRQANIGLLVFAPQFREDPKCEYYPEGCYLVPISTYMRAMSDHNLLAYHWWSKLYGPIQATVRDFKAQASFPISTKYCLIWGAVN